MINKLAKGVFGVFLLHTTSIFIYYRVTYIRTLYEEHGYVALLVVALLIFVIGSFIAFFVENFKSLFEEELTLHSNDIFESFINNIKYKDEYSLFK